VQKKINLVLEKNEFGAGKKYCVFEEKKMWRGKKIRYP
jgi:hypothetical protein